MPLCGAGWSPDKMMPMTRLKAWIEEHFELVPLPRGTEPAATYRIAGTAGRVGFISSMSEPFCGDCSRLRLSATGKIRPCLFSPLEFDLMKLLRGGAGAQEIQNLFRWATWNKPAGHPYRKEGAKESAPGDNAAAGLNLMRSIGG
jgi:cyclic pyranopterin phosphate synthase